MASFFAFPVSSTTSAWKSEDVETAGGNREDSDVVVDRDLITSRYPMDLPAFMREIARKVESQP